MKRHFRAAKGRRGVATSGGDSSNDSPHPHIFYSRIAW